MMRIVALSLFLGLDNLRVTVGLGMLGLDLRTRRRLAVGFGMMEATAPVAGLALGRAVLHVEWVAPASLAACGLLVLAGVARGAHVGRWLATPVAMTALPGLFALDNLAAGIGLGRAETALGSVLVAGCASALWSVVGLTIGSRLSRLPLPTTVIAGVSLLGSAVLTVLA
jgi:manganese efflux pump family protein